MIGMQPKLGAANTIILPEGDNKECYDIQIPYPKGSNMWSNNLKMCQKKSLNVGQNRSE